MKTLHLTNAYHPASGGIRTFYSALLEAAARDRREVVLVVPGAEDGTTEVGGYGRIHVVRAPRSPVFDRRYRLMLPHRYLPLVGSRLAAILEQEQPDLVEICDKYALPYLAAMLRKRWHPRVHRPTLVGLSCERFDDNMGAYCSTARASLRFARWYIRHIYGPPFDFHIANSEYTAGELHAALYDRAPSFIRVAGMGVDPDGFSPLRRSTDLRRRLLHAAGGRDDSVLLLYAGRLSPEKNLPLLVEALTALGADRERDYRLVLAGDGPMRTWLRDEATEAAAGRIVLCGALDREGVADHIASCDVFVHPNPREPFGIAPLEAMASGVPVVVPNRGGVLEYATTSNAWLAPPEPAPFADAIRAAALGSPERRSCAFDTVQRFSWPMVTRRFFRLYDELHEQRLNTLSDSRGLGPSLPSSLRLVH